MRYQCPACGKDTAFRQICTTEHIFDANGRTLHECLISVKKEITCDICGYSAKEKAFEVTGQWEK